jgi:hypothetical protein
MRLATILAVVGAAAAAGVSGGHVFPDPAPSALGVGGPALIARATLPPPSPVRCIRKGVALCYTSHCVVSTATVGGHPATGNQLLCGVIF